MKAVQLFEAGHPLIPGHEFAGDIVKVGAAVTGYDIGDRVSVAPNIGCGCAGGFAGVYEHERKAAVLRRASRS